MSYFGKTRSNTLAVAGRRFLAGSLVAVGISLYVPAAAQEFCSEPVEPYCVSTESEFDTQLQVNRCRDDLNEYEEQVNEYEQCINGQIKGMHKGLSEARSKLDEAEDSF